MFDTTQFIGKDLEGLIRIALVNRELSPGVAAAIASYRERADLTTTQQRQLQILDRAIAEGCIATISG